MGKKKFIDKKKSSTFQLIARDSSDPNYGDSPSGDRVFVRVDGDYLSSNTFFNDHHNDAVSDPDPNGIFADAPEDCSNEDEARERVSEREITRPSEPKSALPDHVSRQILELGFPNDGYNYLLHLREIKNTGGGSTYYQNPNANFYQLPRDVKAYDASRIEISKADDDSYAKSIYSVALKTVGVRIQKAFDPEVAALLDDDSDFSRFGSDVEDLEEDFVINANLPEDPTDVVIDNRLSLVEETEVLKRDSNKSVTSCSQDNAVDIFGVEEVRNQIHDTGVGLVGEKPRVRRPLDEQFDMLELQEYSTDSQDEYNGATSEEDEHQESLAEKLNHTFRDLVIDDMELDRKYEAPSDLLRNNVTDAISLKSAADLIDRCKEYAEKFENDSEDENVVLIEESSDESEVWDCETIISTYSNLDNYPAKIEAPGTRRKKMLAETVAGALSAADHMISLKGKEKLPVNFLPRSRTSATENVKDGSKLSNGLPKKKLGQESKKEKKERKAAVKEDRREARRAKKELKGLYKSEAHHAQKVAAFTGPSSIHLM